MTKFIEDLKANGYVEGDLSTLPADISESDRRKVEQHEAERANEAVKNVTGEKPPLQTFHTELNPNQYGYAEQQALGNPVEDTNSKLTKPKKASDQNKVKQDAPARNADPVDNRVKADPLDHDLDGRRGGHIDNRGKTSDK